MWLKTDTETYSDTMPTTHALLAFRFRDGMQIFLNDSELAEAFLNKIADKVGAAECENCIGNDDHSEVHAHRYSDDLTAKRETEHYYSGKDNAESDSTWRKFLTLVRMYLLFSGA